MPGIQQISLAADMDSAEFSVAPVYARKDEAEWAENMSDTVPELKRRSVHYSRRPPVKGQTDLVKHSFRVTLPTLKEVDGGTSGGFVPQPALDYVTVAELTLWVNPRSSLDERDAAIAAILKNNGDLVEIAQIVTRGGSIY